MLINESVNLLFRIKSRNNMINVEEKKCVRTSSQFFYRAFMTVIKN